MLAKCWSLFYFLLFFPGLIHAQYELSGIVTDEKREPLPGAFVTVYQGDSVMAATLTQEKGQFCFSRLSKSRYRITVAFFNYLTAEDSLFLDSDRENRYVLYPVKDILLEEVVVRADRSNVVGQVAGGTAFHLSATARSMQNVYDALKEVPQLVIDSQDKTIKLSSGEVPLVLINGVRADSRVYTVDPQDIEAVEVIEMPSAKYLSEGFTSVVNLKVKRKQVTYQVFDLSTIHAASLVHGVTDASYEFGNANFSLYGYGSFFYYNRDKAEVNEFQQTSGYLKTREGDRRYTMQSYNVSIGGDWVISPKKYLSYSLTYVSSPEKLDYDMTGLFEKENTKGRAYQTNIIEKTRSYINTYNVYFRQSFSEKRELEAMFRMNLNGNSLKNHTGETYKEGEVYDNYVDYDNFRISSSLEADYSFDFLEHSCEIGAQGYYQKNKIHQVAPSFTPFYYKEWKAYPYISVSRFDRKHLNYAASVGADLLFNHSADIKNSYVRLKASATLSYRINSRHSLRLGYQLNNTPPSIAELNPYNTSTDSLVVRTGNPYLTPVQTQSLSFYYALSCGSFYIQPTVQYKHISDYIKPYGTLQNGIYESTYINEGNYQEVKEGVTFRYNHKQGSIGGSVGYKHYFFPERASEGSIWYSLNFNWHYKKLLLDGYVYHEPYEYGVLYKRKSYTPQSMFTLAYRFTPDFTVKAGMRYFLGQMKFDTDTQDGDYHNFRSLSHKDRKFLVMVGLSFTLHNKASQPQRTKKRLEAEEKGIRL